MQWKDIESAPKDGTEIIGWRDDCGQFLCRYTAMTNFMSTSEIEHDIQEHNLDEETLESYDWFCADFIAGFRLEGSEIPTHWQPLPPPPNGE